MLEKKSILILIIMLLISSCDYIQYSPHELISTDIPFNERNLDTISYNGAMNEAKFSFALIADSHFAFDSLMMAVNHINDINPDFVIHLGDITDNGLNNEFKISNNIMKKLNAPFLVLLGNHDCLANGKNIFKELYGSTDFSFVYGNSKFIILNSNSWEFSGENVPDINWLEDELMDRDLYKHVFVFTHIPPFTRGFDKKKSKSYKNLMKKYNVTYSIHGHNHEFWKGEYYNDGVTYILVDDVGDKNFVIITVDGDKLNLELKAFSGGL